MKPNTEVKFDVLLLVFFTASHTLIFGNVTGFTIASDIGSGLFTLLSAVFFYAYLWLEFEDD